MGSEAALRPIIVSYSFPPSCGEDYVKKRNMSSVEGFSEGYDDHLDPSTLNSFTAGAFRSFHSMAQGFIK
uniref:Uncharacterized protein n=1 Tax=Timema shepardi TaxID=629360 RepID=A0A7R9G214_TIMSH|nr:unnamed protein product [Timema shepardi]